MAEPSADKPKSKPPVMGFTVERVNALSDGVFAVAITLLVLSIAVPSIRGPVTESKLAHGLAELWPHYYAYVLSFVIIAMFWISHHSLFSVIRRVNKVLIWLNIFYLMLICFMPYPTNILSLFGKTTVATVLYAAVLAGASILQGTMALYAVHNRRLVDDDFDVKEAGAYLRHAYIMAGIFIASIGVAFWSPQAARYVWLLLLAVPVVEWLAFGRKRTRENG